VVTLAWMGVGVGVVVALSLGDSDTVSASAYESVDQCSAGGQSRQTCETAFNDARAEHVRASPRYTKLEDCEAEFGANGCLTMTPPDSTGGGAAALFVPAMAGFLLANAASSALSPQPLYRSCTDSNDPQCRNNNSSSSHGVYAGGGRWYYTASGDRVASASGPVSVERGVFTGHAPATTLARGGFGARASMHAAS
jgi:uncharacterized protein YgiB involved in biofilm formation